jgi:RNase adaptor protein for sRNA GlmZ degradation
MSVTAFECQMLMAVTGLQEQLSGISEEVSNIKITQKEMALPVDTRIQEQLSTITADLSNIKKKQERMASSVAPASKNDSSPLLRRYQISRERKRR